MSLWLPRTSSVFARYSTRSNIVRYQPPIRPFPRYQHSKPPPSFTPKPAPSQAEPIPPVPKEHPKGHITTRIWKKVKHEAQHYWHGTKLLVSEVRISRRLQWKILHGETLTRRERRQVSFVC